MYGGGADFDAYDPFAEVADYEPFQEDEDATYKGGQSASDKEEPPGRAGLAEESQQSTPKVVEVRTRVGSDLEESRTSDGVQGRSVRDELATEAPLAAVGQKRPLESDAPADASDSGGAADRPHAQHHRSAVPVVTAADRALWKDCWRVVLKRLGKFSRDGRIAARDVDRLAKKLAQKVFEKERCRERRKAAAEAEAEAAWRTGREGLMLVTSVAPPATASSDSPGASAGEGVAAPETLTSEASTDDASGGVECLGCVVAATERSSLDAAGELRVREYVKAYFDKFGSYASSASGPLWRK
jgi:hypothetical protein